ncbi:uncharacterized protein I303_105558 [Kwoniella dejecticola CBS 10117]|uniref:Uncharacterized protein n=1 Tax=Kwoniella dejecticola CBS 10117 TaxID=1296121 RepID=A0A1A6A248_9TREE|nr:uncharacterized protein I303_04999 [Kwoniella dejecticola CBS 10117]OBR84142.1 hypothetical protein I303_04999 [Kwoniella dejecticola CBS 10117]
MVTSRKVSYILPTPDQPAPLLSLPPLGQQRQGHPAPFFLPKGETNGSGANTPGGTLSSRNPFLSQTQIQTTQPDDKPAHARHCLGITSLALDTSTLLSDSSSPGGILYTGGRDGLVASWELNVPHKKRRGGRYEVQPGRGERVKWERIGDGAEFFDDDEFEDEDGEDNDRLSSEDETDGWVGVTPKQKGEVPYEDRWELDRDELNAAKPPPTTFRQSAQTHTDWVNAMLLCNLNQTVITASSDRTIRAWNPHATSDDPASLSPSLVGSHRDYVRALAWAKYPGLLFSGALDRHLSIWDIKSQVHEPVFNIDLTKVDDFGGVGMEGERGSVYALGVDHAGQVLAAGTPERVVRLWDPRAGDHSIGKLIGHTDCVRSIIFSEDGRYMLTGSSDTTIKLWSLAAHRCLHTYNHHDSSVWSLHSNHPNLERFYSGSRDGYLCVTDLEQCTDISDGECVVLAREGEPQRNGSNVYESKTGDEGIRCITAMDDEYVWTATGSAEIRRWKDVGRRIDRLNKEFDGLSYNIPAERSPPTEVSLTVPSATTGEGINGQHEDLRSISFAPTDSPRNGPTNPASALPTAVRDRLTGSSSQQRLSALSGASIANSVVSEDGRSKHGLNGIPYQSLVCLGVPDSPYSFGFSQHRQEESVPQGLNSLLKPEDGGSPRRISFQTDREQPTARMEYEDREVASEAVPLRTDPDEIIAGRSGLVRSLILNDRQHVLTVDTEGEVAAWNIIKGVCVGRFSSTEVAEALHLERGAGAEKAVRKHSQEVLEMVKERVEGETMVITWCQVDTKIGSLVVHLEEGRVFDAEVYADDLGLEGFDGTKEDIRINLGKWALANLFRGLIKAEENEVRDLAINTATPSTVSSSLPKSPGLGGISIERPADIPHPHRKRAMTGSFSNPKPPSLNIPGLVSPASRPAILPEVFDENGSNDANLSRSAPESNSFFQNFQALKIQQNQAQSPSVSSSYQPNTASPNTERVSYNRDYFTSRRKGDPSPSRETDKSSVGTPATPSTDNKKGFMGKMKGLGRKKQAETPMSPVVEKVVTPEDDGPKVSDREAEQLQILDTVRSHRFSPPGPLEAPFIPLPQSTALLISEESKDAGAWVVTYRSQVSSTERDMEDLEMNSPLWLLDYLFASNVRQKDPVKFTFILEPAPGSGLKELPEGSSRLSASRALRARKISAFIVDKLDLYNPGKFKLPSALTKHTRRSSTTNDETLPQPEEIIELICGHEVVNPKITLATLKAYYGSGPDMLLHYRIKKHD